MVDVGVDTFRVKVPISWKVTDQVDLPMVRPGIYRLDNGGSVHPCPGWAYVEASVATRTFSNNVQALPVGKLVAAVTELLDELGATFEVWDTPVGELEVGRLDLVRDFRDVLMMNVLLDGLSAAGRDARHLTTRYGNSAGTTNMLRVGPRHGWQTYLYDKGLESGRAEAHRLLRHESRFYAPRLRQKWADRNGGKITVVADVTQAKAESFARATFQAAGFDRTVMTQRSAVARVCASDVSPCKRAGLLGYLMAEAEGRDLGLSKASKRNFRRIASDLGLTLVADGPSEALRLDWEHGYQHTGRP